MKKSFLSLAVLFLLFLPFLSENVHGVIEEKLPRKENLTLQDNFSFGYIVELESPSVIDRKIEIEKVIEKEKKEYEEDYKKGNWRWRLTSGVLKRLSIGLDELSKGALIEAYRDEIKKKRSEVKNIVTEKFRGVDKRLITGEWDDVFNGFTVNLNKTQVEWIEKLEEVKEVHPNTKVRVLEEEYPKIERNYTVKVRGLGTTGKGIKIAVLDTGVDYRHPDLGSCTRDEFLSGNCEKVVGGYDFVTCNIFHKGKCIDKKNEDKDPMDDYGHGTHVASIAGGKGLVKGVATDSKILSYKVLNMQGSAKLSWIISGIERAVSDDADIISMSLGGPRKSGSPLEEAANDAVRDGVIVVASAGNSGPGCEKKCPCRSPNYPNGEHESICAPGSAEKVITVGASTDGEVAKDSSRGPVYKSGVEKPDVVAPGVEICAAKWDNIAPWLECLDKRHIPLSGTSMAAPHISGYAARILEKNPSWSPQEVKEYVKNNAIDLGYSKSAQGSGKIDVHTSTSNNPPPYAFIDLNRYEIIYGTRFEIKGKATSNNFDKYKLEIGKGKTPSSWNLIKTSSSQAQNRLAEFDTTQYEPGTYSLRLMVWDNSGRRSIDYRVVEIKHTYISSPKRDLREDLKYIFPVGPWGTYGINLFGSDLEIKGVALNKNLDHYFLKLVEYPEKPATWGSIRKVNVIKEGKNKQEGVLAKNPTRMLKKTGTRKINAGFYKIVLESYDSSNKLIGKSSKLIHIDPYLERVIPVNASRPTIDDLDNDGKGEIVVSDGRELHVLKGNGKELSGWPKQTNIKSGGPAVGDLFNDGKKEIVGIGKGKVYVFSNKGQSLWEKELTQGGVYYLSLGDITGDGKLEIIVLGDDPQGKPSPTFYVLNSNSNYLPGWPNSVGGSPGDFAVGDVNGDNSEEIVVRTSTKIKVFDSDGSVIGEFEESGLKTNPVLGDMNDDGKLDIVVGIGGKIGNTDYTKARAYDYQGNKVWYGKQEFKYQQPISRSPILADLDNNGDLEVIVFTDSYPLIRIFGYQIKQKAPMSGPKGVSNVLVADTNSNGIADNIVPYNGFMPFLTGIDEGWGAMGVVAYNPLKKEAFHFTNTIWSTVKPGLATHGAIGNLDEDSNLELVYSGEVGKYQDGKVKMETRNISVTELGSGRIEWGMFKQNPQQTNSYKSSTYNEPPKADFKISKITPDVGEAVEFTSTSKDDSSISKHEWEFGDGSPSSGKSATHKFDSSRPYKVTLKVWDDKNVYDTKTKTVWVGYGGGNLNPRARFEFSPINSVVDPTPEEVFFDPSKSFDPDGEIANYAFSNVPSTFDTGTFEVKLEVTDNQGGTDSTSRKVTKYANIGKASDPPLPVVTYSPKKPDPNQQVDFDASKSFDLDGSIEKWRWEFGDGGYSDKKNPSHTFTSKGLYDVVLTVSDDKGTPSKRIVSVNVGGVTTTTTSTSTTSTIKEAHVSCSPDPAQTGEKVTCKWENLGWACTCKGEMNFGDGTLEDMKKKRKASHKYQSPGTYKVESKLCNLNWCLFCQPNNCKKDETTVTISGTTTTSTSTTSVTSMTSTTTSITTTTTSGPHISCSPNPVRVGEETTCKWKNLGWVCTCKEKITFGDISTDRVDGPNNITKRKGSHKYGCYGVYTVKAKLCNKNWCMFCQPNNCKISETKVNVEGTLCVKDFGNYPNPFSGTTTFKADGTGIEKIRIKVFDLSGRMVFDSGNVSGNTRGWGGRDNNGNVLPNGAYLYTITAYGGRDSVDSKVLKLLIQNGGGTTTTTITTTTSTTSSSTSTVITSSTSSSTSSSITTSTSMTSSTSTLTTTTSITTTISTSTTSTSTVSSTSSTSTSTTTLTTCPPHCDWERCFYCKCGEEEGDCDADKECESGLICCPDVGKDYGCGNPGVDVCLPKNECYTTSTTSTVSSTTSTTSTSKTSTTTTSSTSTTTSIIQDCNATKCSWDCCYYHGPCNAGEGDCDSDKECKSGLICKEDIGDQYGCASSFDVCKSKGTTTTSSTTTISSTTSSTASTTTATSSVSTSSTTSTSTTTTTTQSCNASKCDWRCCGKYGPCGEDEGDCDSDSECKSGLICKEDIGDQYGCDWSFDVCKPQDITSTSTTTASTTTTSLSTSTSTTASTTTSISNCDASKCDWTCCSKSNPCGKGEGDCDIDAECKSGLKCINDVGDQYGCDWSFDVCG